MLPERTISYLLSSKKDSISSSSISLMSTSKRSKSIPISLKYVITQATPTGRNFVDECKRKLGFINNIFFIFRTPNTPSDANVMPSFSRSFLDLNLKVHF